MAVHYKFKSTVDYETLIFDGSHLTLKELKKAIMQKKRIGKSNDTDLQVTNAQTKEVYEDDSSKIPRNASLLIARIPVIHQKSKQWRGYGENDITVRKMDAKCPIGNAVDLTSLDATEDDKIKTMMYQSASDYDPSNFMKIRGSNQIGPVPSNYKCYKCNQRGHWRKNCTFGHGPNPFPVKKCSGIPRSFLVAVEEPQAPGTMISPDGQFVVPLVNHDANKCEYVPSPVAEPESNVPQSLICSICSEIFSYAVTIPCCGSSFCDECIRGVLLESEDHECFHCHKKGVSPDTLIPNSDLRTSVANFKNSPACVVEGNQEAPTSIKEQNLSPAKDLKSCTPRVPEFDDEYDHDTADSSKFDGDSGVAGSTCSADSLDPISSEDTRSSGNAPLVDSKSSSGELWQYSSSFEEQPAASYYIPVMEQVDSTQPTPWVHQSVSPTISFPPAYDFSPPDFSYMAQGPYSVPPPQDFNPTATAHSWGGFQYDNGMMDRIPTGVIDDPLAEFNKIMREKDERKANKSNRKSEDESRRRGDRIRDHVSRRNQVYQKESYTNNSRGGGSSHKNEKREKFVSHRPGRDTYYYFSGRELSNNKVDRAHRETRDPRSGSMSESGDRPNSIKPVMQRLGVRVEDEIKSLNRSKLINRGGGRHCAKGSTPVEVQDLRNRIQARLSRNESRDQHWTRHHDDSIRNARRKRSPSRSGGERDYKKSKRE